MKAALKSPVGLTPTGAGPKIVSNRMNTLMDKSKELATSLSLVNDKLHFHGTVENQPPVSIDYIPPFGDGLGYTSLELLLLSLSSCLGSALLTFLRRMEKSILSFEIQSRGIRREEHPTGFNTIILEIKISSPDIKESEVSRLIRLSEDTYCPVWAMLKGNVDVQVHFTIIEK